MKKKLALLKKSRHPYSLKIALATLITLLLSLYLKLSKNPPLNPLVILETKYYDLFENKINYVVANNKGGCAISYQTSLFNRGTTLECQKSTPFCSTYYSLAKTRTKDLIRLEISDTELNIVATSSGFKENKAYNIGCGFNVYTHTIQKPEPDNFFSYTSNENVIPTYKTTWFPLEKGIQTPLSTKVLKTLNETIQTAFKYCPIMLLPESHSDPTTIRRNSLFQLNSKNKTLPDNLIILKESFSKYNNKESYKGMDNFFLLSIQRELYSYIPNKKYIKELIQKFQNHESNYKLPLLNTYLASGNSKQKLDDAKIEILNTRTLYWFHHFETIKKSHPNSFFIFLYGAAHHFLLASLLEPYCPPGAFPKLEEFPVD